MVKYKLAPYGAPIKPNHLVEWIPGGTCYSGVTQCNEVASVTKRADGLDERVEIITEFKDMPQRPVTKTISAASVVRAFRPLFLSLLLVGLPSPSVYATPTSTINPTIPKNGDALDANAIRGNFAASFNDVNSLWAGLYAVPSNSMTFTNKAFDTAGTGNQLKINGQIINNYAGNSSTVQLAYGVATPNALVQYDAYGNLSSSGISDALFSSAPANTILAGPTSGSPSAATFRALVGADLPKPTTSTLGGIQALTSTASKWVNAISTSGVPSATQPAFSDISGSVATTQMPALSGDVTTSAGATATTLATVNTNTGSFGSSTAIPTYTVNGKGLLTASGTAAVVAPAGTLTGSSLASGVTGSSLTSVGTLLGLTVTGTVTATSFTGAGTLALGTSLGSGDVVTTYSGSMASQIHNASDGYTGYVLNDSYNNGAGNGGLFQPRFARGTYASPAVVAAADRVGGFIPAAYDGTTFKNVASIEAYMGTGVSAGSSMPSYLIFDTTASGSETRSERMRLNSAGYLGIGTASPTTLLTVNGRATVSDLAFSPTTNGIVGTTTNDSASSGYVGEYVTSAIQSGSAVSLTNAVASNVTSISLTAGDWDVWGNVLSKPQAGTTSTEYAAWVSTTSASLPTNYEASGMNVWQGSIVGTNFVAVPVSPIRLSLSATTTVYLEVYPAFTGSTPSAYGILQARRRR